MNNIIFNFLKNNKVRDCSDDLVETLEIFENEFNNIRPSHAIGGMTPTEMHLKTENY